MAYDDPKLPRAALLGVFFVGFGSAGT